MYGIGCNSKRRGGVYRLLHDGPRPSKEESVCLVMPVRPRAPADGEVFMIHANSTSEAGTRASGSSEAPGVPWRCLQTSEDPPFFRSTCTSLARKGGANETHDETNQSSRGGVWTPLLTSSII